MTIIRCVDLETTGFAAGSGVCEIAYCDLVSTATNLAGEPAGWTVADGRHSWLVNPGCPIPPEVSAVHHLIDEDLAGAPDLDAVCRAIFDPSGNDPATVVLAAHSAKFEQLFLTPERTGPLRWICSYKAALRLWPDAPSHGNQALRYWKKPAGLDRATAAAGHRAFPDAYVTAHLVRDMLNEHPVGIDQLVEWSSQPALQVRCHIGKWRGAKWTEVDYGFLEWVSLRDFDEDVLFTVRHEMERRDAEAARRSQDAVEEAECP